MIESIPQSVKDEARSLLAIIAENKSSYILLGNEIMCDEIGCCSDGLAHHRVILKVISKNR